MPFDFEPEESTELEDVEAAIDDAASVLVALDELACHPGFDSLRSAHVDLIGDAVVALRSAVAQLVERKRDLDGTSAAESKADRDYDEMREWR